MGKFYIEKESVLSMVIDDKITNKNIFENDDNKFGKIIYNSQKENPKILKKSNENWEKEIELVKTLLKENNIESIEKLDLKYSNKKNINYYLIKQALNIWKKIKIMKKKKGKKKMMKRKKMKEKRVIFKKLSVHSPSRELSAEKMNLIIKNWPQGN